jgi:putative endopeptidase
MRFSETIRKIGAGALLFAFSVTTLQAQNKAFDITRMDTTAKACDDFFQYANGNWIKNAIIPSDRARYGSFDLLGEANRSKLREILENSLKDTKARPGSNEQLIRDMYASCMDEAAIEAAGVAPIEKPLRQIAAIKNAKDLQKAFAAAHNNGVGAGFRLGVGIDSKNNTAYVVSAGQGGLSLTRDYYFDDKFKDKREKFVRHISNMFVLLGESRVVADSKAQTVLRVQTELAKISKPPAELRDPDKNYNKLILADWQKLLPDFDWNAYFKARGLKNVKEVIVGQPAFFQGFNAALKSIPLEDWKTYLAWMTLSDAAPALPKRFADESFDFNSRILRGVKEKPARWKQCVQTVDATLGEALGAEFVKKNFTPEAEARMNDLIDNLFAAYKERIQQLDWMTPETKTKALEKLAAYKRKIGYNKKPRGYAGLKISRRSYIENLRAVSRFNIARNTRDLGNPVDKTRWGFSPPTVNASYNPIYNEITFPAGILQPPFFNFEADDAINYGAIGAVIGHEITHGFDDSGSKYDASGSLKSWWTTEDRTKFEQKAACVANQFSGYEVLPGTFINGKLTLGENIADLGGLTMAFNAFKKAEVQKPQPTIDGFTPEQRFFLGYAQIWAEKSTPETVKLLASTDPHANPRFRVNGPLSNLTYFAETWGCKTGDKMVRDERCQIW